MNTSELRRTLEGLTAPEPDRESGRRAVRRKVRDRRIAIGAVVALIAIAVLVPAVLAARRDDHSATVVATRPREGTRIGSTRLGFSVLIPRGWAYEDRGTSNTAPFTSNTMPALFATQSAVGDLPSSTDCGAWADQSVVFTRVQEVGYRKPFQAKSPRYSDAFSQQLSTHERPTHFGPRYGTDGPVSCPGITSNWVDFNDHGRGFNALVIAGPGATPAAIERAFRALDSFRVTTKSVSAFCTAASPNSGRPDAPITRAQRAELLGRLKRSAPTPRLQKAVEHPNRPANAAVLDSYLRNVCDLDPEAVGL